MGQKGNQVNPRIIAVVAVVVLVLLSAMGCMGCTRVGPGHVGIVVNLSGDQRGVKDLPVTTGWVFYNPVTQEVFEYACFMQTAKWEDNERVSFASAEGMQITADMNLSYLLDCQKAPAFYVEFRSDNLEAFTHGFLRNVARDVFNDLGGKHPLEDIYGGKKEEFVSEVKARVQERVAKYGIRIEQFGFIGALKIPDNVTAALNAKIQATQDAIKVENELRSSRAEAQKKVATAEGEKQAAILAAEGTKQAAILEAEGQAEANRRINASLSPGVLEWQRIQVMKQWDGSVPQVQTGSGSGTFFQLPMPSAKGKS